jgi:hypothetical protein
MAWSWKLGKLDVKIFNNLTADFYADLITLVNKPLNFWITIEETSLRILDLSYTRGII